MDMNQDMELHGHRGGGAFPVDDPTEALKKDHDLVKKLFDRYLTTHDTNVKNMAGPQILLLLEMHMTLEEAVFYPKVRDVDPALVDHGEEEHEQAKQLVQQLKGMDPSDPQCDQIMKQLADAVMDHVEEEENKLFPKIQQSNLDLTEIGVQMQAFEASMIAAQARASGQTGLHR